MAMTSGAIEIDKYSVIRRGELWDLELTTPEIKDWSSLGTRNQIRNCGSTV